MLLGKSEYGYDALPAYVGPGEGPIASPEVAKDHPPIFNSGARIQSDFRSQRHNIASLLKLRPRPVVTLSLRDAEARGIASVVAVDVVSPRGRVRYVALVSEDIVPGVIEASAGDGSLDATPVWRQNINQLTDADNRDPLSGFPGSRDSGFLRPPTGSIVRVTAMPKLVRRPYMHIKNASLSGEIDGPMIGNRFLI